MNLMMSGLYRRVVGSLIAVAAIGAAMPVAAQQGAASAKMHVTATVVRSCAFSSSDAEVRLSCGSGAASVSAVNTTGRHEPLVPTPDGLAYAFVPDLVEVLAPVSSGPSAHVVKAVTPRDVLVTIVF